MTAILSRHSISRCVELIPPLLVMMLNDLGKLPAIPNLPLPGKLGFRKPELADMESAKWLAAWGGPKVDKDGFRQVAGLACFRDYYEMHTSADVRELCAIRGTPRAVVELTRWLRDDAEMHERRLVGSIERHSLGLAQLMMKLGGVPVARDPWEYLPCRV